MVAGEAPGLRGRSRAAAWAAWTDCAQQGEVSRRTIVIFCSQTLLLSPKFHCTEEILTVVSLLSVDSVLYDPPSRRDEVQAVRRKFMSSEGDHIMLLNIYRAFKNLGRSKVGLGRGLLSRGASSHMHELGAHLPSWWNVPSPPLVCKGLTGETRNADLRPARVPLVLTGQGPCVWHGPASLLQMSFLPPARPVCTVAFAWRVFRFLRPEWEQHSRTPLSEGRAICEPSRRPEWQTGKPLIRTEMSFRAPRPGKRPALHGPDTIVPAANRCAR